MKPDWVLGNLVLLLGCLVTMPILGVVCLGSLGLRFLRRSLAALDPLSEPPRALPGTTPAPSPFE